MMCDFMDYNELSGKLENKGVSYLSDGMKRALDKLGHSNAALEAYRIAIDELPVAMDTFVNNLNMRIKYMDDDGPRSLSRASGWKEDFGYMDSELHDNVVREMLAHDYSTGPRFGEVSEELKDKKTAKFLKHVSYGNVRRALDNLKNAREIAGEELINYIGEKLDKNSNDARTAYWIIEGRQNDPLTHGDINYLKTFYSGDNEKIVKALYDVDKVRQGTGMYVPPGATIHFLREMSLMSDDISESVKKYTEQVGKPTFKVVLNLFSRTSEEYAASLGKMIKEPQISKRLLMLERSWLDLSALVGNMEWAEEPLFRTVLRKVLKSEKMAGKITKVLEGARNIVHDKDLKKYASSIEPDLAYTLIEDAGDLGRVFPKSHELHNLFHPPEGKILNGVDIAHLEYYADIIGKEVNLRSLETHKEMEKEVGYLREALQKSKDGGLRKRLENLEKMLSNPDNDAKIADRLKREVAEKEKEYKFQAIRKVFRQRFSYVLHDLMEEGKKDAVYGITPVRMIEVGDDVKNALKVYKACDEWKINKDICKKTLKRAIVGDADWKWYEDRNAEFLQKMGLRGMDTEKWIKGFGVTCDIEGKELKIWAENDPIKILNMGAYVTNSCLNPNGNSPSTIPNFTDANKRVIYASDKKGEILARAVIAIDNDGKLCQGGYYLRDIRDNKLKPLVKGFIHEYAKELNLELNDWLKHGEIESLLGGEWYNSIKDDIELRPI